MSKKTFKKLIETRRLIAVPKKQGEEVRYTLYGNPRS